MHAKKPAEYLTCPRCKGSDFHYTGVDGTTSKQNNYNCRGCGFVIARRAEKCWKSGNK